GFQMLADSPVEMVQLGALITRTHHERWDGGGYPRGLAGEDIPPEGRIAALADVFDALTSDRVYRPALPVRSAVEIMQEESGHFDPEMLQELCAALPEMEAIRTVYADLRAPRERTVRSPRADGLLESEPYGLRGLTGSSRAKPGGSQ